MEQSQPLPAPAVGTESQILKKKNNTAKIIASIMSVMAVVGIAFGVYGMIQSQSKDRQISDLKHQIEDSKTTATSNETGDGMSDEGASEFDSTDDDSSRLYRYRYEDGTIVSFVLPQDWGYIEVQNKKDSCATKGCLNLILAPDSYLEQAANYSGFYMTMYLLGQYDGTPSLVAGTTNYDGTPKSLIETYTGLYVDGMVDSDESVNGCPTYYRRVSNNSYIDINFAIQNSKNDILIANSRIESWHYSYPEYEVDEHEDYKIYEKDIEQIMKSVKFSQ